MRRRLLLLTAAAAAWAAPLALMAQEPASPAAADHPTFEVASVKRNRSGDAGMRIGGPPGRFTMTNVPIRNLILQAYQLQPSQLIGGPDWLNEERYDIVASTGGSGAPVGPFAGRGGGPNPLWLMTQSLLTDRFKLEVHNETRELPVYALVVARSDGRLGAQLKPTEVDCATMFARGRGDGPPPPPPPGQRPPCSFMMGMGNFAASSVPMSELARTLSPRVGRMVIDKTGLTGLYDFELTFMPDQMPQGVPAGPPPPGAPPLPAVDPNAPSLFTALQEQLGLKLESARAPVEVLVIDSVERPTED